MRVFVTGAAGFIGTHLCSELIEFGHDVVAVDGFLDDLYPSSIKEANASYLRSRHGLNVVRADLRGPIPPDLVHGCEAVVNLAAMAGLVKSWSHFETYLACNVSAVHNLVEVCRDAGVRRFVQASTSSVYGEIAIGGEDSVLRPASPYGVTKLAAENLLRAHEAAGDLDVTILRYFSVYGPGQRPDMAYHRFIDALVNDREIAVYGDGSQTRTNTYVTDVATATRRAVEAHLPQATLNVAGVEEISMLEAIHHLAASLGVRPRIRFFAPRLGDQRTTRGDSGLARRLLGDWAHVPVRTGLELQAQWQVGSSLNLPKQ
jgi:UDP-glucuronate 4-epimerase